MLSASDIASLILVGAFWGCTNPLLRRGSASVGIPADNQNIADQPPPTSKRFVASVLSTLSKFANVGVWAPYVLNQFGSLLYYNLLSHSDMTLAVPICNALALVFSCMTSFMLGERVDQPWRAVAGASLVMIGVAICISAGVSPSENESSETGKFQQSAQVRSPSGEL